MKEIICPYSWDCGKKIEPQELSKFDYDFLKSASEKKMIFMMLDCPNCSRTFQFDTVQWKAGECGYSDPNIVGRKNKKTTKQLAAILNKAKIEIPISYFDYLISEEFNPQISIFLNEESFSLYELHVLCEKINVDGKSYLTIGQLKGFINTLLEVVGERSEKENEVSYTDLSCFLAIGFENTRLLCIDYRDNNSLWVFHTDNGDVERIQMRLTDISKR